MKTQSFVIADAASSWSQQGLWSVLYYEEGVSATGGNGLIRVRALQGAGVVDCELKPGRQITLAQPVEGLIVTSLTGEGVTGKLSLGNGNIQDASLIGEVSIIDAAVSRVTSGRAFACGVSTTVGAAGTYCYAQLFNPGTSTRRVIVTRAGANEGSNTTFAWMVSAGEYVNSAGTPRSKRPGLGVTQARVNHGGMANVIANPLRQNFRVGGNGDDWDLSKEPIVLVPGNGLLVQNIGTAISEFFANFEWWEEAL